jgi:SET domain-containing protein
MDCNPVGLYGLGAFINHSCFANAIATPLKDLFILKASRNIDQGEEICIDYIYFT